MYISCNQLKKYIQDSDKIDFMQVAKDFTIIAAWYLRLTENTSLENGIVNKKAKKV